MQDSRQIVLDRIRSSLKTSVLPMARASISPREAAPSSDYAAMSQSFQRDMETVGAKIHRPANDFAAVDLVVDLIQELGSNEILAWDDAELPLAGLPYALHKAGIRRADHRIPNDDIGRKQKLAALSALRVGLTGASAGLADTGSLAVISSPTRPRLASLLPMTHISLLPINRLYPTMAAFFAAHPGVMQDASNLVFISGPSRTADIEMTLTVGVHGPKYIHVVLCP
ncbi:MAG: LUD domain-containing protein [Chloroflexi bacterium]|jgi:L-lactate dehydrogenase complex protein LldG|nr:LUD domain-containing protein [Chloroflexota bacterium]